MSQVSDSDVELIRDWLAKEPHLPKTFDNIILKKFLYSSDGNVEKAKKCIQEFCTRRANMSEIYTNRDPLSKSIQSVFTTTVVTKYMDGNNEILIHRLREVASDYDFYESLKGFTMQCDSWIQHDYSVLPESHTIILDIEQYSLKLVAKSNVFYFQKLISFLLDCMPIRLKHVHIINCPSYYQYMYNMVKPVLSEHICNLMHFHSDHTGLHKFINQKCLPKDYGGDCMDMVEQNASWVKLICENRAFYLDDSLWKTDLSPNVKNSTTENHIDGSSNALVID